MSYNEIMNKKDIKKLQEQIDQDEKLKPKPAEKKLKIKKSFNEVMEKIARFKKS